MTAAVLYLQSWVGGMPSPRPHKLVKSTKSHLAALAPRYQAWADDTVGGPPIPARKLVNVPRTRLPPRSRFGCWTCRTRKVKCDEARPKCTPCARLGHTCDYDPRLSFKDDTSKVIERNSGSRGAPGPVWNPRPGKRQCLRGKEDDLLPTFAALRNDEDRERKAEFRKPGTYHVVVNPTSFVNYEEYREKDNNCYTLGKCGSRHSSSMRTPNNQNANHPFHVANSLRSHTQKSDDPDIVVLQVFEDDSQVLTPSPGELSAAQGQNARASAFSNFSALSLASSVSTDWQRRSPATYAHENSPLMRMAHPDGRDHQLIYYFKNFVYHYLLQVHRDSLGTPLETSSVPSADVLERQAAIFPPLYHALMAFSALTIPQQSRSIQCLSATALQHYQQTLPSLQASLRTESDLTSDGVLLTHFVLLLYELAAGEPYGLSLWQQHISQLLRIILLRRELYGMEPYSFIVWWVANIDTYILLAGLGSGTFVGTMLQQNLLPSGLEPDEYHQPSSVSAATPNHLSAPRPLLSGLPSALAFHRRICTLAAQLGLLARDLREEERRNAMYRCCTMTMAARQRRVATFLDLLRRTWSAQMSVPGIGNPCNLNLPVGARGLYEHSYALHRALILYTHTSLPVSSHSSTPTSNPAIATELQSATRDILHLAREIVTHSHLERKFMVFPLFMAGYVSPNPSEKSEILSLVQMLEDDALGGHVVAARKLLEEVYKRQEQERLSRGWDYEWHIETCSEGSKVEDRVDWIALMREMGLQAVNSRL